MPDELTDELQEWCDEGIIAIEQYLAKYAAFADYLDSSVNEV
jgi:predicted nucleic-acid-binding protein